MKLTVTGSRRAIRADQYDDVYEYISNINPNFTSANTSTNDKKKPALFSIPMFKSKLKPGTINLDYGGGKFDNVAQFLQEFDVINLVLDPFNRTKEHNKEVIETLKKAGGADSGTCANVLNVIERKEDRMWVLKNLRTLVKPGGWIYIWIHEGHGDDIPTTSKKHGEEQYQLNRKTSGYLTEIREVFPEAKQLSNSGKKETDKSQLIAFQNPGGSVSASVKASRGFDAGLVTI